MTARFCWEKWTNGSEWFLNVADDAGFLIEKCFMKTCRQKSRYFNIFVCRHVRSCHSRFQKQNKIPQNWKNILPPSPNRSTDPRQPHKTKSSPFQCRSRDEDDLRKKKLHDWGTAEKKEYLSKRLRDTAWIITYFLGGSKWNMFVVIRYALKIN